MMNTKIVNHILLFLAISTTAYGQELHAPMDHEIHSTIDKYVQKKNVNFHTSVRPFYRFELDNVYNADSLLNKMKADNRLYLKSGKWWAKALRWSENAVMDDHFIQAEFDNVKLRVNPGFDLHFGNERIANFNTWSNQRSASVEGQIGERFYFSTSFYETQREFLPQIRTYLNQSFVVPGQGRWKHFKDGTAVDYGFARASMAYRANKNFTFQFGHDKNFIGDGYRSLLLSDNAFNYPFFKIETTFWNIKYVNIYAQLNHMGFTSAEDRLFDRKYFAMQYLSWNVTKRFNISLFETVMWRSLPTREFDLNYLNPIVFMRPVEFQNGSKDAMMLGATSKFKLTDGISLYGQILVDDLRVSEFKNGTNWWGNKYGLQAGLKAYDLFKIKGLSAQAEYNTARPYTYTHSDSITSYSQLNSALAHPLGANFKEGLAFIRYNHKRHYVQLRASKAIYGADTSGINHGQNIFLSYNTNRLKVEGVDGEFGHQTLQGLNTELVFLEAKYGYMINPSSNLMFEVGISERSLTNSNSENKTRLVFFGIRTALSNFYYDFL